MLLPVIVCMCFIASSLLFLVQMIVKSEEENITDLYNAANQTKTALLKQIEGDKGCKRLKKRLEKYVDIDLEKI